MRRVSLMVGGLLVAQMAMPRPAAAWFGWVDELSGPKGFKGLQIDARVRCFGAPQSELDKALMAFLERNDVLQQQIMLLERNRELLDRLPPATTMAVLGPLGRMQDQSSNLAHAARGLIGTYADGRAVQLLFGPRNPLEREEGDLRRIPGGEPEQRTFRAAENSDNQRLNSQLTAVLNAFTNWRADYEKVGNIGQGLIALPAPGFRVSLCKEREDMERRFSLDIGTRIFWATDTSPEVEGQSEAFANGHKMWMFTAIPSVSLRPLYFRTKDCAGRECQRLVWLDWLDLNGGAGYYRISSDGFAPLQKTVLEGRLDFHVPSEIRQRYPWTQVIPQFSLGSLGFVGGFDQNAFGPHLTGPKSNRIDKTVDWSREYAFFVDIGPLFK